MVVLDISDMDECLGEVSNDCSAVADCINTVGSYNCQCKPGYGGDGTNCSGVDMRLVITVSEYHINVPTCMLNKYFIYQIPVHEKHGLTYVKTFCRC